MLISLTNNDKPLEKITKFIIIKNLTSLNDFWVKVGSKSIHFGISWICSRPFDYHLKIKVNYGIIEPIKAIQSLKIGRSDGSIVFFNNLLERKNTLWSNYQSQRCSMILTFPIIFIALKISSSISFVIGGSTSSSSSSSSSSWITSVSVRCLRSRSSTDAWSLNPVKCVIFVIKQAKKRWYTFQLFPEHYPFSPFPTATVDQLPDYERHT